MGLRKVVNSIGSTAPAATKALNSAPAVAQAGFWLIAGYVLYKSLKGWQEVGKGIEAGAGWAGEKVGEWLSPDVVGAQIRLKSSYFLPDGTLRSEAQQVLSTGYPNFYRVAFTGGKIRPEYSYLVDSGLPVIDGDYKP